MTEEAKTPKLTPGQRDRLRLVATGGYRPATERGTDTDRELIALDLVELNGLHAAQITPAGLEAVRNRDPDNFAEELADVLIRVLDCARGCGIDIGHEVAKKLEKNRGRGFRHGGKVL